MEKPNHNRLIIIAILSFTLLVTAQSCSYRKSLPLKGPLERQNEAVRNGQLHFMEHCQKCHPHGEGGLGPAFNHLPNFPKRLQVRLGLGVMPAFQKKEISKKELDDIMAYLKALHKNKGNE